MKIEVIDEGFITKRKANTPTALAVGPRCVQIDNGELVCTYILQEKLGLNDFKPAISRSKDNGKTWTEQGFIWPHLCDQYSIFGSISRGQNGDCFFYGSRTPIETPGESFWCDETKGMKQNELIWAKSTDGGLRWTEPAVIPMPIPGSAECPGAMFITKNGNWLCCYSPYNTFDPTVVVEQNQVILLRSSDEAKSWTHNSMLKFENENSGAAEAWVVELNDDKLLGTCWHINHSDGSDHPNAYALSHDGGLTWQPTCSTKIMGQTTALSALPDGRALFIYNQRKHGQVGVWLAVANPADSDFGIEANQVIWKAQTATQNDSQVNLENWEDFAFGQPSITVLNDNTLLAALWCKQPKGQCGIYYVKLKLVGR